MIKTTRKWFCDACHKEIDEYMSSRSIIEIDEDGYPQSIGYDFCKECTISFNEWMKSRGENRE